MSIADRRRSSGGRTPVRRQPDVPAVRRRPATTAAPAPTVDGYELLAEIGRGATATVFGAIDRTTGAEVALKCFDAGHRDNRIAAIGADPAEPAVTRAGCATSDQDAAALDRRRFAWEVRVARQLRGHPHLLAVLDAGIAADGRPYLVSALHRRGTLRDAVAAGGPLRAGELAVAGRQLAFALEVVHARGLVHGDVKPENIFVGDDDALVLGDLGAAWLRADGGPAGALTPAFAAPEVWLGGPPTVAADLYALGATLLFAATGHLPIAGTPPAPRTAAMLGDAAALLAQDPAQRPASAAHAARAFGHAAAGDPWTAAHPARRRRSDRRAWQAAMAVATPTLTYRSPFSPAGWRGSAGGRTA